MDDQGRIISNVVYTLLTNIIHHFLGRKSHIHDRIKIQLHNLRYRSLTEIRWYKDVFLTKVFTLETANTGYWKKRFIVGLPKFFSEKVRQQLNKEYGKNSLDRITYGEIISKINEVGINMYTKIKLKKNK